MGRRAQEADRRLVSADFRRRDDAGRQAVQTGCAVELTEISLSGAHYVSVGFEARGAPELLRPALEHAADLVFAVPPPAGSGFSFSLDNCQPYVQWLDQQRPHQAVSA
jgi:hypothetical protein